MGTLNTNIVPLVTVNVPRFASILDTVPKPRRVAPALLVRLPPASTPPESSKVPLLAQAGVTFRAWPSALSVPVLTGANERLASELSVNVPRLTRPLLIAPWKKNEPVLVIGPLKVALAERNTVPALLSPPLT